MPYKLMAGEPLSAYGQFSLCLQTGEDRGGDAAGPLQKGQRSRGLEV